MPNDLDPEAIASDLRTLADGRWTRQDAFAIARLLTQLGILAALLGGGSALSCPIDDAPSSADTDGGSSDTG